jgi:glycosyltransferase involved in cell wall biosynthesis
MNLAISLEQRFARTPDGRVWVASTYGEAFWRPYLKVFDSVTIIARVEDLQRCPPNWLRADGAQVSFVALPYYIGPRQYLAKRRELRRILAEQATRDSAFVLRVPSQIAFTFARYLRQQHRPFGLQVVGDPYDVFAPGVVQHPLRRWFRYSFKRQQQRLCKQAIALTYVTERILQQRYPPSPAAISVSLSNVTLTDQAYAAAPRVYSGDHRTLITIGAMDQLYKGIDVLLDSLRICHDKGLSLRLVVIGDGKYRPQLEAQAARLGLSEFVRFTGQISSAEDIQRELDQADLYVMASRTEGLPRALLEAMARGLACIGTTVGGIPELLQPDALVPPEDAPKLAEKIQQFVNNPALMTERASGNLTKAQEYHLAQLERRLHRFLDYLHYTTRQMRA